MKNIKRRIEYRMGDIQTMRSCFYFIDHPLPRDMRAMYRFFGEIHKEMLVLSRKTLPLYWVVRSQMK